MAPKKRNRSTPGEAPASALAPAPVLNEYQLSRQARMAENQEKMKQLGIHDILAGAISKNGSKNKRAPKIPDQPPRRSTRLKDAPPPYYKEKVERLSGGGKRPARDLSLVGRGTEPEVYTQEHVKLLGHAQQEWVLYQDGKKQTDKNGISCHQCRQKTLARTTVCRGPRCVGVQSQFCGDCLYTRYGEHLLEVAEDPKWRCPVCRDICNCSACRHKKGWAPTGLLYRSVLNAGYRSVAHYLILTRQQRGGEGAAA